MTLLDMSLGEIVCQIPGASQVFFKHRINFCCQGADSLRQTLLKHDQEMDQILQNLSMLQHRKSTEQDWSQQSNQALIEHILSRYHQVHREQLSELIRLSSRVEKVHRDRPGCPVGLSQHLQNMMTELVHHMQKEEMILFPMLAKGHSAMASGPIGVMMAEHQDHTQAIKTIYELTNDLQLPENACNTWRALYLGLEDFIQDIVMHMHLENDILFAR